MWTGFAMTILSAALKSVPDEIIEAARVDGANEWTVFRVIMIPMILPTITVVITTMVINVLKLFDIVYVMTGGNFGTQVIANRMYTEMYINFNTGRGTAVAVVLIVLIIPFIYYNIRRFLEQEAFTVNNYIDALVGYRGTSTYLEVCREGTQPTDLNCNIGDLLNPRGMGRAFVNSLTVTIPATILPILFAAFAGYAFSWMEFRGRMWLFALLVGLQVVPLQMTLVPISRLYAQLGLNGTFLGVWLFHTGFGMPYAIYLMRNFLGSLPRDLFESAYLDVNAAALGEYHWGAARNLNTFIYLTIGTGIGGGSMLDGRMLHGLTHPEMGHIRVPHDWDRDPFPGTCPYHGDCLEGLAAGPSIEKRYGQRGENLPENHPAWTLLADYLALALSNFICTISPQRIILGGGVMEQEQLIRTTRQRVQELLNGYIYASEILEHIDSYIVRPKLGNKAGVLGAIALAFSAGNLPPDINLASSGPNTIS
jgi:ABC-type glycerol-3-phosphate transport system permease component